MLTRFLDDEKKKIVLRAKIEQRHFYTGALFYLFDASAVDARVAGRATPTPATSASYRVRLRRARAAQHSCGSCECFDVCRIHKSYFSLNGVGEMATFFFFFENFQQYFTTWHF